MHGEHRLAEPPSTSSGRSSRCHLATGSGGWTDLTTTAEDGCEVLAELRLDSGVEAAPVCSGHMAPKAARARGHEELARRLEHRAIDER